MKRLYLLSALMLIMAVAMLPHNMKAQAPVWDGTWETWTQGSGTQADPYLIETPQHLAWLARQVNKNDSTYNGVCFRLTNDLDMNSLDWESIGNSTTNCFKGNFDGNNHFIDNVIVRYYTDANGNAINGTYAGLFGVINNATIMNLGVKSTITFVGGIKPIWIGGIVAITSGSNNNIINCYHLGNISCSGWLSTPATGPSGGIIGVVDGETTLTNCQNFGLVYDSTQWPPSSEGYSGGYSCLGGLIGSIGATATLINCSNSGAVSGLFGIGSSYHDESECGGLIGSVYNNVISITIENSYNNGEIQGETCGGLIGTSSAMSMVINNSYNTGALSGYYEGGLVGSVSGTCTLTNSYNTGSISNGTTQGGLVGYSNGSIIISRCHNSGVLIANNESHWYRGYDRCCGGIVGVCSGTTTISYCANNGSVTVPNLKPSYSSSYSSNAYAYCGGIIGKANTTVTLDRCYNTAVITGLGTNANGYSVFGHVGGLVGHLPASANNIHECYNTGNVTSKSQCGGILGYSEGVTSITNCYNTGSLSGTNNNVSSIAYGTATITNCYYLNTCGGSTNTGCESLTSAQMKSSSFPGMLNVGVQAYTMDGNPNVNQGYPIFGDMVYAVSTQNATNVGVTRATLHGNYVGGADMVGFQYRENTTGSAWNTVYATVGSPVSYLLTGLQSNTGYVFRFMVENNGGVYYGEEKTFTTGACNLTASVSPSSVTICQGETAIVTASEQSSLGNQFSYSWNTGETTPTISVLGGGERIVTISDSNGCSATASVNVTVNPLPAVAISGNTTLCVGESSLLTASGGSSYVWNTGASTPSITVSNGGTYSVTSSNSYGCSSSASVQVISLENVSISGNLNICQGQSTTLYANGTGSYLWNTGATTSSVTVTQAGLYTVTVSLGNCSSSASVLVSIAANPVPSISGNTTICQGETSLLTANGGSSYVWSNGSTNNSIGVSQSGTYSVTATSMEGCSGSTNVFVTVNPLPNVNISGNNSFCQGDSLTLTATGANTYVWNNASTNASITVSSAGNYTVTGTDANGCSNTATKTVTVNPTYNIPLTHSICQGESYNFYGQNITTAGTYMHTLQTVNGCDSIINLTLTVKNLPTPSISGNTVICQGQSTTLTANGGNSYVWSNASTNNSINVSQSGVYTVTATNVEGCSNTANVTVTVNPLPNVNISGNNSFCQGDNVTLTATGANAYVWNNASTNASITVSSAGNYTVTGTDANGCSNTATKTVTVNPTFNIPLTHSICQGESYNFYGQNITTAGTYTHTLQTVNGCDSIITLTLTVKNLPTPSILGNTVICQGQSTTLTANGGTSYVWSNASTNNSINVSQSGVYSVTATNAEGCSNTANVTVTVNPLPNVNISGNNSFCQGDSLTLTATGANTYVWNNASTNASITVSSASNYTVTGTDANGCSNTAIKTVTVNPTYNVALTHSMCEGENYNFYGQNITVAGTYTHTLQTVNGCDSVLTLTVTLKALPPTAITGNTTLCEGETTTLTANGGTSYLWSNAATTNSINVSQSGVYTVTATNVEGCSNTANITVTVNPLPTITIGGNTTICAGSSTTLTASGANTYIWSTGDNTASVTINAFGVYTVTGTSSEGCSNTASVTVLVSQLPNITIAGETDICAGESTTLTANGGETYLWNDGTTDNTLTVSTAGTYQVIGYNAAGCNAMASATVNIWQPATSEFTIETSDSCYTWNSIPYCTSGTYIQTLQTIHGCDSVVTLYLTVSVGIDDLEGFDFMVYPNPTTGIVNVQCTMNNVQEGTMEFHVFDAFGRLLRTTDGVETLRATSLQTDTNGNSTQTAQIDLSHYAAGVYFIKAVADGNVVAVRKVVKR